MPLIMLPNPYVYFTHTNLFSKATFCLRKHYSTSTPVSFKYLHYIYLQILINYNKSEQISCSYLLTISLYNTAYTVCI